MHLFIYAYVIYAIIPTKLFYSLFTTYCIECFPIVLNIDYPGFTYVFSLSYLFPMLQWLVSVFPFLLLLLLFKNNKSTLLFLRRSFSSAMFSIYCSLLITFRNTSKQLALANKKQTEITEICLTIINLSCRFFISFMIHCPLMIAFSLLLNQDGF